MRCSKLSSTSSLLLPIELPAEPVDTSFAEGFPHAERLRDRLQNERRVIQRGERYEEDAILEVLDGFGRKTHRQSGLARSSGPGQAEKTNIHPPQQCAQLVQ